MYTWYVICFDTITFYFTLHINVIFSYIFQQEYCVSNTIVQSYFRTNYILLYERYSFRLFESYCSDVICNSSESVPMCIAVYLRTNIIYV